MARKLKILAVDDNSLNLLILQEILSDSYELTFASGGCEALQTAVSFCPDIVLLDVMMPDIDGLATCRQLRQFPQLKNAFIVLMSAKALPTEKAAGLRVGADSYLTKPFDESELLSLLEDFKNRQFGGCLIGK